MSETTGVCPEHGDELIWEPGGDDMPTIYGRRYCPTCQVLLMAALDTLPNDTPRTTARDETRTP